MQHLHRIVLLVSDQQEALDYFTGKLGFELTEDTWVTPQKRWVVVTPPKSTSPGILLAKAAGPEQESRVGNQTGGKVLVVLHTDDIERDHERLSKNGVEIVRGPVSEAWGKVLIFRDLYGNLWDLVQPA